MREDRYRDVLRPGWQLRGTIRPANVPAETGTVFEDAVSGWVGAVLSADATQMRLEDRHGQTRLFPLGGGYLIDGKPVVALPPTRGISPVKSQTRLTASGSRAAPQHRARVARASRIWVEGTHDAELLEKVWGDDLREAAVVVEPIGGVDRLADRLALEPPTPRARVGMLVDHLIPGSKETRLATAAMASVPTGTLLVVGHPYIDVWQAVKPATLQIPDWPSIPKGVEWKQGICAAFGWPGKTQEDIHRAWRRILSQVEQLTDLEPSFAGRVEELIDFVTAPSSPSL